MRLAVVAVLAAWPIIAPAQDKPAADAGTEAEAKAQKKADAKKDKPPPRVMFKRNGGSVGDDAAGGGARSAEPSRGGTPGTPSGSFTRP